MLAALDEGVAQARRVAQGMEGHLTATFVNISPYESLLRGLRRFRAAHPAVSFTRCARRPRASRSRRWNWARRHRPHAPSRRQRAQSAFRDPAERAGADRLASLAPSGRMRCGGTGRAQGRCVRRRRARSVRAFMTSWCRCAWRRASRRAWRRKRGGWRRWWRWWPAVSARPCCQPRWRASRDVVFRPISVDAPGAAAAGSAAGLAGW